MPRPRASMNSRIGNQRAQARWHQGIVRLLWPHAPRIGTPDRIWCGVCKHEDGRDVCCTVGGPGDRYRKCQIIGYQIELGDKGNPDTKGCEGITLLVKVRMNQPHPLIERVHLSHIDCLGSYAKKPNSDYPNANG